MRVVVNLFAGEVVNVDESLDTQDCRDFLEHAKQFRLKRPLRLLLLYCKARILQ